MKEIYFAGGCFWGIEAYFKRVEGIVDTDVGYANSISENPTYEEVCSGRTLAAETVKIIYDQKKISLSKLLEKLFKVIDPTLINRQGPDIGHQYRSGVYFTDDRDKKIIDDFIESIKNNYKREIVTEVKKLESFYLAEEYHQDYLDKNHDGYCHINLNS